MTERISIKEIEPNAYKAMYELENYTKKSEIPIELSELIKIRASQINGCGYCVDMHTEHAMTGGENENRILALPGWKKSHLFTEKEKSALQITEEITLISNNGLKTETYNNAINLFGEKQLAQLIMQIVVINSWNRIAIATKLIYK
jgi:AhpD family alkylhydroperoxidase